MGFAVIGCGFQGQSVGTGKDKDVDSKQNDKIVELKKRYEELEKRTSVELFNKISTQPMQIGELIFYPSLKSLDGRNDQIPSLSRWTKNHIDELLAAKKEMDRLNCPSASSTTGGAGLSANDLQQIIGALAALQQARDEARFGVRQGGLPPQDFYLPGPTLRGSENPCPPGYELIPLR